MTTWTGTIPIAGQPRGAGVGGGDFTGVRGLPVGGASSADGDWSRVGDLAIALLEGLLSRRESAASHTTSQSFPPPAESSAGGTGLPTAGASRPDARGIEHIDPRSVLPLAAPDARPSFESEVRGQAPREIDLELARMAQDVSDLDSQGIDGWTRLDEEQLAAANIDPSMLEDPETGFRAALYTDGNGRYVLAFAGTNDWRDWLHNARQGVGLDSEQYESALRLARDAEAAFGDDLVITGYSLGGGLASIAALGTDTAAVTFNAAGLHDSTIRALGYDPAAARAAAEGGLVRRYAVDGEALTGAQEEGSLAGMLPDAVGQKIELEDPDPLSFWERWIPGNEEWFHPVQLHLMDSVLAALEADRPWGD